MKINKPKKNIYIKKIYVIKNNRTPFFEHLNLELLFLKKRSGLPAQNRFLYFDVEHS